MIDLGSFLLGCFAGASGLLVAEACICKMCVGRVRRALRGAVKAEVTQ